MIPIVNNGLTDKINPTIKIPHDKLELMLTAGAIVLRSTNGIYSLLC